MKQGLKKTKVTATDVKKAEKLLDRVKNEGADVDPFYVFELLEALIHDMKVYMKI